MMCDVIHFNDWENKLTYTYPQFLKGNLIKQDTW